MATEHDTWATALTVEQMSESMISGLDPVRRAEFIRKPPRALPLAPPLFRMIFGPDRFIVYVTEYLSDGKSRLYPVSEVIHQTQHAVPPA